MTLPVLLVLVCSTRPTRIGPSVARWVQGAAAASGTFDARLVDLADFALPVFDEAKHPRLGQYEREHTKAFARAIASGDAIAFVGPEYNHGPTPALVNALSYLEAEWAYKAAGLVNYGGQSGGIRAAQLTKTILLALRMVPVKEGVVLHHVRDMLGADGELAPPASAGKAAAEMFAELRRMSDALAPLRRSAAH